MPPADVLIMKVILFALCYLTCGLTSEEVYGRDNKTAHLCETRDYNVRDYCSVRATFH